MADERGDRRIVVFGTSGQIGHALLSALPQHSVVGLDRTAADLSRPDSLPEIVRAHRPDVVVIAAAYTAVDRAEDEPHLSQIVNVVSPGIIASAAESIGASVVYYSTDYVFDGTKAEPYSETDAPHPLSVYGRTKFAGERAVAAACTRHLLFRTSWVFSPHGTNFLKTILRLASERPTLRVVSDQVGAPTSADLVAHVTATTVHTLRGAARDDARWGTYHLAAGGTTNWYEYARYVITRARALGFSITAGPESVIPILAADYPTRARRPLNSRLNTARLRSTFAVDLPDWTREVDRALEQLTAA